ncbi:MAG: UDP-2,3-diacylglucosamine diphosphatase, partial [Ignavibacteria bacterium]
AVLIEDGAVVEIGGVPTLLLHGDTLCTDDDAYQQFRAQVRSPEWQREFLARPLAERKAEIAGLRERSEAGKRAKSTALMDVTAAAVAQAYAAHGVARIVHGHTHRQACHRDAGGERWVLPDWDDTRGTALACDDSGCRWLAAPSS